MNQYFSGTYICFIGNLKVEFDLSNQAKVFNTNVTELSHISVFATVSNVSKFVQKSDM